MTPYFHTVTAFIHMGGYGQFVWAAYGFVAIGLIGQSIKAKQQLRQSIKKLMEHDEPKTPA